MKTELLNKVDKLRDNELYSVQREDDMIIAVTNDINKLPLIIKEEMCVSSVVITDITYHKHDYTYTVQSILIDEDEEENEYEFKLSTVLKY